MLRKLAFALAGVTVFIAAIIGVRLLAAYHSVSRVPFDSPSAVRQRLSTTTLTTVPVTTTSTPATTLTPTPTSTVPPSTAPAVPSTSSTIASPTSTAVPTTPVPSNPEVSPLLPDAMFDTFLLIGREGQRADTMLLVLLPADGANPIIASLPRDLYLPNPCKGTYTRLNAGLNGCGSAASGFELLSVMITDYTGVTVNHVASIDFNGFVTAVNLLGGVSVCVGDTPVRDRYSMLDLPAGCSVVNGAEALSWVRSRHTEQLVNGEWVSARASDLTRQAHQQDLLIQVMTRVASFRTLAAFTDVAARIAPAIRLDDSLTLGNAITAAWSLHTATAGTTSRVPIRWDSYRNETTSAGATVLRAAVPFNTLLGSVYPPAVR